ncbi:Hypothetical Protein FCC1311_116802, partial [Hondaea fermentalgiana]
SGGNLVAEGVTIDGGAMSAVTTLSASGDMTNSGGNIVLSKAGAQSITHADGSELSISSGGGVVVDGVTMNNGALSAVSSLSMSDDLTLSKAAAAITHSGATSLTISSGGDLVAEGVTINGGAVSS